MCLFPLCLRRSHSGSGPKSSSEAHSERPFPGVHPVVDHNVQCRQLKPGLQAVRAHGLESSMQSLCTGCCWDNGLQQGQVLGGGLQQGQLLGGGLQQGQLLGGGTSMHMPHGTMHSVACPGVLLGSMGCRIGCGVDFCKLALLAVACPH